MNKKDKKKSPGGDEIFRPSRPALGPTQPPVKWVPGSFPKVKCGRGVLLTTHPLLVPRSWESRATTLPTLWATLGHTGPVTGTLYLYSVYVLAECLTTLCLAHTTQCRRTGWVVNELEVMWIRGSLGWILATSGVLLEGTRKATRNFNHDLRVSEPGQTICCRCGCGGSALGFRQVRV